jgi:hypothetical protein
MWQKIIANEEAHEDKIINQSFEVHFESWVRYGQVKLQVLPQGPDVKKLHTINSTATRKPDEEDR